MLFFRSEERVREWCVAHGYPMRPLVTMDQLWTLATTWYSTRLQENSRRPQADKSASPLDKWLIFQYQVKSHQCPSRNGSASRTGINRVFAVFVLCVTFFVSL